MNYAAVGAFVIGLGAVLVAAVLWLASGGALQKKYDLYQAIEDESVAGLNLNAPVKFNGVTVGKVRSIALEPAHPERVRLVFSIEHDTPINAATLATLKTQGLTGIAYVELSGGAPGAPPLLASTPGQYPQIRTKPSLSARLENVLTNVLGKVDSMSTHLDAILSDGNREAIKSTLADLAVVSHTLAGRKDSIDQGLASAARTFENSARVTAQMGPLVERIGRSADAVDQLGVQVGRASTQAGKTVAAVGGELQRATAELMPQLQDLLGEIGELSVSLRRLSEQTERNPSSLLFGSNAPHEGPGEGGGPGPGEAR